MKRRILVFLLCVIAAIGFFAGCGKSKADSPAATGTQTGTTGVASKTEADSKTGTDPKTGTDEAANPETDKITIGISMNALDEAQTIWYNLLKERADQLGYEVIMYNANSDVQTQISDVETLCQLKPDVIIIKAVDTEGSVAAFEACDEAGIPTMAVHFDVNYEHTLKLTLSQYTAASKSADYLIDYLDKNPDASLKIGYIWGAQSQPPTQMRYKGFKEPLMEKYADRVEIIAEKECGWDTTNAQNTVEDWIQAYPEINCVVCQSDEMATGAINALQSANIGIDKCMVLGFNSSEAALQAIREGTMTGSVLFVIYKDQVDITMAYVEAVAGGENLAGQSVDMGIGATTFTTIENVDEVEKMLQY